MSDFSERVGAPRDNSLRKTAFLTSLMTTTFPSGKSDGRTTLQPGTSPQPSGEPGGAGIDATLAPDDLIQALGIRTDDCPHPGGAPAISLLVSLINADRVTQHYGRSFD
jgi:hypothetical protein